MLKPRWSGNSSADRRGELVERGEHMEPEKRVDIVELSGKIDALKEAIDGRFGTHDRRLKDLEVWRNVSEGFHVEMRKRWDHFDGMQEAEKETQLERHRSNANKINLLMLLVTILVCLAAWATFIRPSANHSFVDFHSQTEVAHNESAHW